MDTSYEPIFELTRGRIVESIHFGAAAVVDSHGRLLASIGNPQTVTFLRSTAKPFQALPFIERRGHEKFHLTPEEIAIICASHSGTDEHVSVVQSIQSKVGVTVDDLLCGTHHPYDEATNNRLIARGEEPSPFRHNCSGKHSGMLAHAKLRNLPIENYIDPNHPIQESILTAFAEMCDLSTDQVELGIDGCSAPNFAVPLYNAALAYARLCEPEGLAQERAEACHKITSSMVTNPFMVGGPGRFDTLVMQVGEGRILVKGGAEGYQGIGLFPKAIGSDSPGIGIAIKISDGDPTSRARHGIGLAILNSLGALTETQATALKEFGPQLDLYNFRHLKVGTSRPVTKL